MCKIFIVKQFASFYSHLGFQFLPITCKNASWYTFLLNIFILIILFYSLFFNDPWNSSQMSLSIKQKRPLMAILTKHLMKGVFPTLFHCNLIYFFLNGRKIIQLLDHQLFWNIYNNNKNFTFLFYLIIIFQIINCFLSNPNMFFAHKNTVTQNINLFTTVTIALTEHVIYFILHYSQYGSLQVLIKINKNNLLLKNETVSTIQSLSFLSKQINRLMSFPFMINILISVIDFISIICSSLIVLNKFMFFNLYYIFENILNFLYLYYIVYLNSQLMHTLFCISQKLTNSDIYKKIYLKHVNNIYVCPQLVENYQETFKLKLFDLITINYHNLISICFIILNYVIFLYQTY